MAPTKFSNESTYRKFLESGKEAEFDSLFDAAATKVRSDFGVDHPLVIGGKETRAAEQIAERSPIDSKILIGRFQKATRIEAKSAIEAARAAFTEWSQTNYKDRIVIIRRAADIFSQQKFELAASLSYENGKSRYESVGEVDEAIDFLRYYANEMEANKGFSRKTSITASSKKAAAGFQGAPGEAEVVNVSLKPYGVFGVIAPFNFPISISVGMSAGAIITGNTVVFKPSSTDNMSMLTGLRICEIFAEAGMPAGVFNYLTGPGSEIGDELVTNPGVDGIAFTGSKRTGLQMIARSFDMGMKKVFVVEMGGKNPAIVTQTADLDCAAEGVASAAFGFAGQKCSALSRVYVHESVKELFLSKLIEKVRSFKTGDPINKEVYIGPLISEQTYAVYLDAVKKIRSEGRLMYGGNRINTGLEGFYVEPVIAEIAPNNELFQKELFTPILLFATYEKFESALQMANDTEYGLTAGLYTKKQSEIKTFERGIRAGTVYVNRCTSATTGAMVGAHTFVGWKDSGLTGKGTGSKFYLQQFMKEQSFSITK